MALAADLETSPGRSSSPDGWREPAGWIPVGIAGLAVLFQRLVSRDVGRARDAGTDPRDTVG